MRPLVILILIGSFFSTHFFGQTFMEPGIGLRPTVATINTGSYPAGYEPAFSFSYGAQFLVPGDRLAVSYGIYDLSFNAVFDMEITTPEKPQGGTDEYFQMKTRVKTISIPVTMYYLHPFRERYLLMAGLSVYSNSVYVQENVILPGSGVDCVEGTVFTMPHRRPLYCTTSIDLFENHFFAVMPVLEVSRMVADNLRLRASAGYFFHLRRDQPKEHYDYTARIRAFSLDFTLNYRFSQE